MSEKVTFGELIESIANETDNSRKFTHDFLKNFVSVINSGLEDDGKVNIAGFGKFELRQMDKREGYNPQTGEKMTIPAQNKVVFKPYKELRELVNAPYAHLESELIEEDTEPQEDKQEEEQTVPQADQKEQPVDPETTDELETDTSQEQLQENEEEETSQIDTPSFAWDGPESDEPFKPDQPVSEADDEEEQKESEDIVAFDQAGPAEEATQQEQQKEEPAAADTSGDKPETVASKKKKDPSAWGIAAVIVLVIIVAGAWLITSSNSSGEQNEPVASATVQPGNENSEQQEPASPETQQNQPSTPAPANAQPQNNLPAATSASNAPQQNQQAEQEMEALEVNEGQTLWSIAENNYEDPYLWPWIYEANKTSIDNPNLIVAGNSLSLPVPDLPDYNLSSTDSLEVAIGYVETYRWHKEQETESAKFYLWAAKTYDQEVFEHIDRPIDKEDLAFVNRVR